MLVDKLWYKQWVLWPLVPFSTLFSLIVACRRKCYQLGLMARHKPKVPVIVIGNLTVGGTGKTPLVIHIAQLLADQGLKPGILHSGYKGNLSKPTLVHSNSNPSEVGDEALLLARQSHCPVVAYSDRVKGLEFLIEHEKIDIVLCDDGLQHYALKRHIEIAVIDGLRRFGNGYCLPAGPLREPTKRLMEVDLCITNGGTPEANEYAMDYQVAPLYQAINPEEKCDLSSFSGQTVHAVAGIGNPKRFFSLLEQFDIRVIAVPYPDHHAFQSKDIHFDDTLPVFMTEKDFVKCRSFVGPQHWVVPISPQVSQGFDEKLLSLVKEVSNGS